MHDRTPKAILFDLDCTLTDRAATLARYAPVFVERFGPQLAGADCGRVVSALAEVDGLGYRPRSECWAHLLDALPWRERPPAPRELEQLWQERWPACAAAAADVALVLGALGRRGYRLGVITNGPAASQERKVEAIGVRSALTTVVVSGAVGVAKPDPAIFRLACDRTGVAAA
ncbi:MAG TPA: HAD family hydrolase, partial [Tepidisphaeraceae bacterium]|nr:HAD family hydrolase [Tepidisphaeraceae bacterium]